MVLNPELGRFNTMYIRIFVALTLLYYKILQVKFRKMKSAEFVQDVPG